MKRTKLCDRQLPSYSKGEERMNTITHIVGAALSIIALILCLIHAAWNRNLYGVIGSAIYGVSLITLYTMSSVYHGLKPGMPKKVMQVLDHCTIYFLIAGTYTVLVLSAIRPVFPAIGWGLFAFEWSVAAIATTLTAIDLRKYRVLSMICYIGLGWAILPFAGQVMEVLTPAGFLFLLLGGIVYTIGAILYGVGVRKKWMHSVFHIFVLLGSILQFFAVLLYAL